MKSRKECYQALLDGKTLKGKVGVYAKIDSGALIQSSDLKIWVQSTLLFKHPGDWSIYEEPPKPKYEVRIVLFLNILLWVFILQKCFKG